MPFLRIWTAKLWPYGPQSLPRSASTGMCEPTINIPDWIRDWEGIGMQDLSGRQAHDCETVRSGWMDRLCEFSDAPGSAPAGTFPQLPREESTARDCLMAWKFHMPSMVPADLWWESEEV